MNVKDVLDFWRARQPKVREGTYISTVQESWARLDYWLGIHDGYGWVAQIEHMPRTLSDHSPVVLTLILTCL